MKLKAYLAMIDGNILKNVCMCKWKVADAESTEQREEGIPTIKRFVAFD